MSGHLPRLLPAAARRADAGSLVGRVLRGLHTEIRVALEPLRRGVRLTVENECVQPPDGPLDRLFDRFYRPDASRTAATGGYGIGLSIGKAYPLSNTWNIEWELGGAAVWARYNEYRCRECGAFLGRKHGWYLIPSRVALNMIYLF